jgi:hypothetical protein
MNYRRIRNLEEYELSYDCISDCKRNKRKSNLKDLVTELDLKDLFEY